jgi:hypothetical protein
MALTPQMLPDFNFPESRVLIIITGKPVPAALATKVLTSLPRRNDMHEKVRSRSSPCRFAYFELIAQ